MTTIAELAEILKEVAEHGCEVQQRRQGTTHERADREDYARWNIDAYEYRLKPRVTYYRVYRQQGAFKVDVSYTEFSDADGWGSANDDRKVIKDFEIEE